MHNDTTTFATSLDRYIPAPKNGERCPISGLAHALFYQRVINGPGRHHVRIVDMREPGASRGKKLIHAGDLLAWLNSIAKVDETAEVEVRA